MNKISAVCRGFDVAVNFFILSGGLLFLSYIFQSKKPVYLLVGVVIYVSSFIMRNIILKIKHRVGFSEIGMVFVSLLFLAYTLYFLKIDQEFAMYLPDRLMVNYGGAFILLMLMHIFSPNNNGGMMSVLAFAVMTLVVLFGNKLNLAFQNYPIIASFVIGTPYVYLLSLLTGMHIVKTKGN